MGNTETLVTDKQNKQLIYLWNKIGKGYFDINYFNGYAKEDFLKSIRGYAGIIQVGENFVLASDPTNIPLVEEKTDNGNDVNPGSSSKMKVVKYAGIGLVLYFLFKRFV